MWMMWTWWVERVVQDPGRGMCRSIAVTLGKSSLDTDNRKGRKLQAWHARRLSEEGALCFAKALGWRLRELQMCAPLLGRPVQLARAAARSALSAASRIVPGCRSGGRVQ